MSNVVVSMPLVGLRSFLRSLDKGLEWNISSVNALCRAEIISTGKDPKDDPQNNPDVSMPYVGLRSFLRGRRS